LPRTFSILAAALLAGWAVAQSNTGVFAGTVRSELGEPLSGVEVRVISVATGSRIVVTTALAGEFLVPSLLPGDYTVEVDAQPATRITISAGETLRSDLPPESSQLAQTEVQLLPNLTRDPFALARLTANSSDSGAGARGLGLAINGQRESSIAVVLDGVNSRDEFSSGPAIPIPLDSVQELSLITSGFPATYGRASGGVFRLSTRSESGNFHASLYEYSSLSALASNSFLDNANDSARAAFTRNQFGAALGGPLHANRLFWFTNLEATLVRSSATQLAWIPTPQLLSQTAPETQVFFAALGQTRPDLQTVGTVSLGQLTAMSGRSPCLGFACITLPATLPLLRHVAYRSPFNAGAGVPQNSWNSWTRLDYNRSERTQLYGRYAVYREHDLSGTLSNSPYADFDLAARQLDQSMLISAIHRWSARWTSHSSIAFDRLRAEQQGLTSRGIVPSMYANPLAPVVVGNDPVAFPGYNPLSPGAGGAFGGPENILQLTHETAWSTGKHFLRLGGTYEWIEDNRTDASYQSAVDALSNTTGLGPPLVGLLYGTFAQIQVAVDPQGKVPCTVSPSTCSLNLPLHSPNFSRSNRYREVGLYAQDEWRAARHLTISAGIRWDFFGVQHNANPALDSNWYSPIAGSLIEYLVYGSLAPAASSPVGELYRPRWKNFAPRLGVAWSPFSGAGTVFRAGGGLAYDRIFNNVTFNVLRNAPNYAILDVPGPISTSNFGPLAAPSGTITLPPSEARIIDPNLRTARAWLWNASVEHRFFRSLSVAVEYDGSRGIDLYSVSYPNQAGFRNFIFGDPCTGLGDCRTQPSPFYSQYVGYRGNQGFSSYRALNNRVQFRNSHLMLTANYTWSHAVDNISSAFFETGAQGVRNLLGNANITTNNGLFDAGLLDPFHPSLDRGDADFDVRHRVVVWGNWRLPWLHGWTADAILTAHSGQPFSVFDTISQTLDLSAPRAIFLGDPPRSRNTFVPSPNPDSWRLFTFSPLQFLHLPNLLTPTSSWSSGMSARNSFRAPGFRNLDLAITKSIRISESRSIDLRGEFFNALNHANLYVIGATADLGITNTIEGCRGCTGSSWDHRQIQLSARFRF
jgi:hypothetical protein